MLNEREIESCYLGQFIPVHYHHNMLMDQNRMHSFKSAIYHAVKPLTSAYVGFSDLHEEQQEKYSDESQKERRRKLSCEALEEDVTDVKIPGIHCQWRGLTNPAGSNVRK